MNLFESVKENITARAAAEYYGIRVNRNGMACCPFHSDRTPSMKLDKRYHCFGCQADGDVINLVAGMFGLGQKDAAEKLAEDFGIPYDRPGQKRRTHKRQKKPKMDPKKILEELVTQKKEEYWQILCTYRLLLVKWKEVYAPSMEDEEWHPLFCEALENLTRVEALLDDLWESPPEGWAEFIATCGKEVERIGRRIGEFNAGSEGGADETADGS